MLGCECFCLHNKHSDYDEFIPLPQPQPFSLPSPIPDWPPGNLSFDFFDTSQNFPFWLIFRGIKMIFCFLFSLRHFFSFLFLEIVFLLIIYLTMEYDDYDS